MLLLLVLSVGVIILESAILNSVQVISYNVLPKTKDGPAMCALDAANETTSSSSLEHCSLKCAQDAICAGFNIKNSLTCDHINTPVLATTSRTRWPVITSIHLHWVQYQELAYLWSHQYTCTGFNIKNSLTCDHFITPLLASASRTHSLVFTSVHLYWLQHQELTHLWSHQYTCTGYSIKNSLTCDHINTPVLASTSRTRWPVITSIHLYWLQHQELAHLWSHQYTCTGYNIKNSLTCDHINTPVLASTSRTHSPVICTIICRKSSHLFQPAHSTRLMSFQAICI